MGSRPSCTLHALVGATVQHPGKAATSAATARAGSADTSAMTGRELRAQLCVQQQRTQHATDPQLVTALELHPGWDQPSVARRERALKMLSEQPERQITLVAQAGNPALVTVAIRGVAVGDFEIPGEHYDPFALMTLLQEHREGK